MLPCKSGHINKGFTKEANHQITTYHTNMSTWLLPCGQVEGQGSNPRPHG